MTALQALLIFLISFMVVAVLFKMPVSFALGTSSLLVLAFGGYNLVTVPQFAFSGLDSFALLAIPFYIFAGVIMEYSGISKMLIDWIKSFVGRIRGATGVITICACMAFGVLTGSAMATISAIGKMMVPELEKEGYPKAYNSALLAATCFLGILIPPSVPGIMYALASGGKISEIWMSTIGPAFIFAVGYFVINYFRIGRHQVKPEKVNMAFSEKARQIGKSTFYAIPALLMPIIIYGAIYGGRRCELRLRYPLFRRSENHQQKEDPDHLLALLRHRRCVHCRYRSAERLLCCGRQGHDAGRYLLLPVQPDHGQYLQPLGLPADDQHPVHLHGHIHGH